MHACGKQHFIFYNHESVKRLVLKNAEALAGTRMRSLKSHATVVFASFSLSCAAPRAFFFLSVFCNLFLCQRELVTPLNNVRFKINLTSCIPLMLELVYNLASPLFCCWALYKHRGRWNPKKVTVCQNNKLSYVTCARFHRNHCTEVRWDKEPRGRCLTLLLTYWAASASLVL